MRNYHRTSFRHLNDAGRYRDVDYLGDDSWIGPNETVPHGLTTADEPPWWSAGPWERRPFAIERAFDEDRGQGREYGHDFGLGYGRPSDTQQASERRRDDPYDRRIADPGAYDWVHGYGRGAHSGPRAERRSDQSIYRDLRARLAKHAGAEADDVGVTVRDGEVLLSGVVEDFRLRYLAEDVANDVVGASAVRNHVRVRTAEDTRLGGSRQWTGASRGSVGASRR
jgi:hypothetical protein